MPSKSLFRRIVILWLIVFAGISACDLNVTTPPTLPPPDLGTNVYSIIRWTNPDRAIDIVFVADSGYGNLSNVNNRQTFLNDVANIIDTGFWQNNAIVSNLGLFNFWYSTASGGSVTANTTGGICPNVTFPNLTSAAFAEMVVIVHQNNLRDCGGGARASSQSGAGNEWIAVHEMGHAAFGLPDEYCCDGGYWNVSPVLYSLQASCTGDAANAGWRNCQSFTANNGTQWWRSEDNNIDVMRDAGPPSWEYGPGGWVVVRNVLNGLPGVTANNPSVFAPTDWNWP
jgi:hypothetical protein